MGDWPVAMRWPAASRRWDSRNLLVSQNCFEYVFSEAYEVRRERSYNPSGGGELRP
jgi:hypothetical protein